MTDIRLQLPACDRCSCGVMDADTVIREFDPMFGGYRLVEHKGNPHLYGRCLCDCHQANPARPGEPPRRRVAAASDTAT